MILKKKEKKSEIEIVYGKNHEFIITKIKIGDSHAYTSLDGINFIYSRIYDLKENIVHNRTIFGVYDLLNYDVQIHEIKYIKSNFSAKVEIKTTMDEKTKRITFKSENK